MFIRPQTGPLSLLPPDGASIVAQTSGDWTDSRTWGGGMVPGNLARVLIPQGQVVTVDGQISERIKIIRIDGKLRFSSSTDTALRVETIVQSPTGELEIGTASSPIPPTVRSTITIIDEGDIVPMSDQWEKGLILMGKTVVYGAAKTSWLRVRSNPARGATTVSLEAPPSGWDAGDRVVIAGTDPNDAGSDEVAVIQSVSDMTVTLSAPLTKDHLSPAPDLRVHVANLTRNVVIESESAPNPMDRGHIMFMGTHDVDFNNVRIHKMGRTRKDIPLDDWFIGEDDMFTAAGSARKNVRGRYSIHFHRGGAHPNLTPARVAGCVVEDDPGWAYANHSSYVNFDQNVSYNVIGGAFQTESGDELGSFTNNIAIRTVNPAYPIRMEFPENAPDVRENAQDFAFQGDGFWIHGGGVSLSGNVVSGASGHAFIYWPEGLIEPGFPSGTYRNTFKPANLGLPSGINLTEDVVATGWVPIAGFLNNEAYSAGVGLSTYYLHTTFFNDKSDYDPSYIETIHSVFDGFKAWNIDQQGIQLNFTERVTLKNVRMVNGDRDPTSVGLWASHYRSLQKHVYENVSIEGFGTGIALPPQGWVTVACGNLKNRTNLSIPSPGLKFRDMRITGITTEPDPGFSDSVDIRMEASFSPPEDKFPLFFLLPDKIVLNYGPHRERRLYFDEQAANYRPLPSDSEPYTFFEEERYILPEFAGKTNQQLQADYRMSFGGSILPEGAAISSTIIGGRTHPWQAVDLNIPVCMDVARETELEKINGCVTSAGADKVGRTLPAYRHPSPDCR